MGNYEYALIVVGLINLFFGFYTWRSAKHSQSVRFFAFSLFSVGIWGLGLAAFLSASSVQAALFWAKFHYIASIYLVYFLLIFIVAVSKRGKVVLWKQILLALPVTIVTLIIIFSNTLLIKGVSLEETGNVALLYRPGHIVYGAVFLVYYSSILLINLKNLLESRGVARKQLSLIFWGLLSAGILGGVFNLVLPLMGNYKLVWVGPQFTIIFLALTFIGILKYQLFNIRLLVGKVTFILGSGMLIYASFLFFFWLNQQLFSSLFDWEAITFGVFIAISFVVLYESYRSFLQNNIQSRIINPNFNAPETLKEFNTSLGKVVSKEEILKMLYDTIHRSINPLYFSVILESNGKIINKQYQGNKVFDHSSVFQSIQSHPNLRKEYLLLSEYVGMIQTQSSDQVSSLEFFIKILEKNDLHLLIPVFYNEKLIAVLVLGKRDLSNTSYIGDEIDFLESLASITGISLVRAVLYEQVEDLNKNLQAKVSEQTFELQKKVKELEEARRKEADMIDIMGHELRTPMSVVKLNTDLLNKFTEKITQGKEDFKTYLARIKDSVDTEIKLINTLLSSAKLEGDKIELNLEKVNIAEQIKMSLHAHEKEAKQKGIELNTSLDVGNTSVYADHARTVEILNNLISNAIKYTDEGTVTVEAKKENNFVRVSIIDTGHGIAKEDIPKLGSKFYRTRNYLNNPENGEEVSIVRPGGTGLGLYVSFNLVKKMGGQIYVQSEVGKGSNFTFFLPVYQNQDDGKPKELDSKDMFARLGLKK